MEALHPKFVHLPLALALILPLLSAGIALSWWRGWLPRRAWLIVMLFQVALVASGFVAMQSGEDDTHTAERVVSSALIQEHEAAAELFLWISVGALLLSLIATVAQDKRVGLRYASMTALATAAAATAAFDAGSRGGALVYQHGAARAFIEARAVQETVEQDTEILPQSSQSERPKAPGEE